MVDNPL
jgi:hypothetical protein